MQLKNMQLKKQSRASHARNEMEHWTNKEGGWKSMSGSSVSKKTGCSNRFKQDAAKKMRFKD